MENPTWLSIQGKLLVGEELTPLEAFIHKWQPKEDGTDEFINELNEVLNDIKTQNN